MRLPDVSPFVRFAPGARIGPPQLPGGGLAVHGEQRVRLGQPPPNSESTSMACPLPQRGRRAGSASDGGRGTAPHEESRAIAAPEPTKENSDRARWVIGPAGAERKKWFRVTFGLAFRPPIVRSAFRLPVSSVDLSVRSYRLLGTTLYATRRLSIPLGTIGPLFSGPPALDADGPEDDHPGQAHPEARPCLRVGHEVADVDHPADRGEDAQRYLEQLLQWTCPVAVTAGAWERPAAPP